MGNVTENLFNPPDKRAQIEGVLDFYNYNKNVDVVTRLERAALEAFVTKDTIGYRASVIQQALAELWSTGAIDYNGSLYEV